MRALWLVGGCVGAGCYHVPAYQCAASVECDDRAGGTCEADGACSYPDAACPSGRRYGDHAGDQSGTCVGAAGADAGTDARGDAGLTGLVGHWPLEDLSGADATGGGHPMQVIATPTVVTGMVGLALAFDGTNNLRIPGFENAAFPQSGTVAFWIYSDDFATVYQGVFAGYSQTENHLFVRTIPGPMLQFACQEIGVDVPYPAAVVVPVTGGWHHVAFTWDTVGELFAVYWDRQLRGDMPITNDWAPTEQFVTLMRYFPGVLDEVRLYDRPLDEAEVAAIP